MNTKIELKPAIEVDEIKMAEPLPDDLASDLLWGAAAIGKFLGIEMHQAHHRLATGKIPGKKIGANWLASKSRLTRFMLEGL